MACGSLAAFNHTTHNLRHQKPPRNILETKPSPGNPNHGTPSPDATRPRADEGDSAHRGVPADLGSSVNPHELRFRNKLGGLGVGLLQGRFGELVWSGFRIGTNSFGADLSCCQCFWEAQRTSQKQRTLTGQSYGPAMQPYVHPQ